jgi:hypothetical protein
MQYDSAFFKITPEIGPDKLKERLPIVPHRTE